MKVWKSYKFWSVIFLCFVGIWFYRASNVMYYKASPIVVEPAPAPDGEFKNKSGESGEVLDRRAPVPPPPPRVPRAPMTTPKEPVDVWDWVVKIGGGLTGLKTILEIIDKLKGHRKVTA
jgi:hypothetical protein